MSRRKVTVCLGLWIAGSGTLANAQQPGAFFSPSGQPSAAQSPLVYIPPQQLFQQQPSQQQPSQQQPFQQQPSQQQYIQRQTAPQQNSIQQQQPPQYPVQQQSDFKKSAGGTPQTVIQPTGYHRQQLQGQLAHQQACGDECLQCQSKGAICQEPSSCWTSFYRNVRWPLPFRAQDVSSVTNFFNIQRENGWRLHNTVGHAMFDPQTNCLTQAGKNHVQSILRDNPSDHKVVYVLQGPTQKHTSARVESTELAISELIPVGDLPPVFVTDRDAPGSSGSYQTLVMQAMKASTPVPRVPPAAGAAAGAGSAGGGAAAGTP